MNTIRYKVSVCLVLRVDKERTEMRCRLSCRQGRPREDGRRAHHPQGHQRLLRERDALVAEGRLLRALRRRERQRLQGPAGQAGRLVEVGREVVVGTGGTKDLRRVWWGRRKAWRVG